MDNRPAPLQQPTATIGAAPAPGRLLSLDAFRGLVIVLMFFVNLAANDAAYPQWFEHAGWNGGKHGQWIADYVFPWFLFIVGCAIPFSMNSGRGRAMATEQKILTALRRGLVIYLLGILIWMAKSAKDGVSWGTLVGGGEGFIAKPGTAITWGTFAHWDILPLIGLGYFVAVCLYQLPRVAQIVIVLAILIAKFVAMPDLSTTVGLVRADWMAGRDDPEFGARNIGFWGTAIAQGLPATATVMLGVFAGDLLRSTMAPARKFAWLLGAGVVITAISAIVAVALGHRYSKDFFTTSYVLISCGSGAVVLAMLYGMLDWARWSRVRAYVAAGGLFAVLAVLPQFFVSSGSGAWFTGQQANAASTAFGALGVLMFSLAVLNRGRRKLGGPALPAEARFLVVMGSNAIVIYVVAEIMWTMFWMHWRVMSPGSWGGQQAFAALQLWAADVVDYACSGSFARGLGPWIATAVYTLIYWALAYGMYKRRIFIKV